MLKPLAVRAAGLLLREGRGRALALGGSVIAFGTPELNFLPNGVPTFGGAYSPAQTLPCMAVRWLTFHPYGFALADLPTVARWVGGAFAGVLLVATLAGLGRPGRSEGSFVLRAGWVPAAAFLANPGTWYQHGTVLGVGLAALLQRAGQHCVVVLWGWTWHAFVGWTPWLGVGTLGALGMWVLLFGERR